MESEQLERFTLNARSRNVAERIVLAFEREGYGNRVLQAYALHDNRGGLLASGTRAEMQATRATCLARSVGVVPGDIRRAPRVLFIGADRWLYEIAILAERDEDAPALIRAMLTNPAIETAARLGASPHSLLRMAREK